MHVATSNPAPSGALNRSSRAWWRLAPLRTRFSLLLGAIFVTFFTALIALQGNPSGYPLLTWGYPVLYGLLSGAQWIQAVVMGSRSRTTVPDHFDALNLPASLRLRCQVWIVAAMWAYTLLNTAIWNLVPGEYSPTALGRTFLLAACTLTIPTGLLLTDAARLRRQMTPAPFVPSQSRRGNKDDAKSATITVTDPLWRMAMRDQMVVVAVSFGAATLMAVIAGLFSFSTSTFAAAISPIIVTTLLTGMFAPSNLHTWVALHGERKRFIRASMLTTGLAGIVFALISSSLVWLLNTVGLIHFDASLSGLVLMFIPLGLWCATLSGIFQVVRPWVGGILAFMALFAISAPMGLMDQQLTPKNWQLTGMLIWTAVTLLIWVLCTLWLIPARALRMDLSRPTASQMFAKSSA